MTEEATNPKPSMILPSTYKNTCKFIYFEYAGAEKQTTKSQFLSSFLLLLSHAKLLTNIAN